MKKLITALLAAAIVIAPVSASYAGNGNDNHKHWKKQGHNNKQWHGNKKHGNNYYHGKKKNYYHGGNKYYTNKYYYNNNNNNFYEDPNFWAGIAGGLIGGAIINNQRNDYYEPQCWIQQVQVWDPYYQTWTIQNRQVCN